MVAKALATQGTRTLATMILAKLSRDNSVSARKGFKLSTPHFHSRTHGLMLITVTHDPSLQTAELIRYYFMHVHALKLIFDSQAKL